MIKAWPLDKTSDSADLMTYVWLEIYKIRVELNKLEDLLESCRSERDYSKRKDDISNYVAAIDLMQNFINSLDEVTDKLDDEIKGLSGEDLKSRWIQSPLGQR